MSKTATYRLVEDRLGKDLRRHVVALWKRGESWNAIARDLHGRTDIAVTSAPAPLRAGQGGLLRPSRPAGAAREPPGPPNRFGAPAGRESPTENSEAGPPRQERPGFTTTERDCPT